MSRLFALLLGACASLVACSDESPAGAGGAGGDVPSSTGSAVTAASSAATGGGGGGGGDGSFHELSVVTWNLEQFPKAADTMEVVTAAVEDLRPDVLAMQEIEEEGTSLGALDEALVDYQAIGAEDGDGFRKVALLYRPDRVTLEGVSTLFRSDDRAFPRPMLTATVRLVDDPARAVVLGVVHLKANIDDESAARRREACIAIDDWITTRQQAGVAFPFLIVGDFNDQLTDPEEWNVFGPLLETDDGGFLTRALEEAGDHTYLPFDSFIDHALVRGGDAFEGGTAEVLHLEDTIPGYVSKVSDHIPVRAVLRLPAP